MKYIVTFLVGIIPFTAGLAAVCAASYVGALILIEYPLLVLAPIIIAAVYEVGKIVQEERR